VEEERDGGSLGRKVSSVTRIMLGLGIWVSGSLGLQIIMATPCHRCRLQENDRVNFEVPWCGGSSQVK
jgi:hypothetical protein